MKKENIPPIAEDSEQDSVDIELNLGYVPEINFWQVYTTP